MDDFFVVGDKSFSLKHVVCITKKSRGEKTIFNINLIGVSEPLRIEATEEEAKKLNEFFE
jgi:hypothetical protein